MLGDSLNKNKNMESTRLPPAYNNSTVYGSSMHPNEMRIEGQYGQTSIPASSFINQGGAGSLSTHSQNSQQVHSQAVHSPNQTEFLYPQQNHTIRTVNSIHGAPPNQNYGMQQQHHQAYSLPVYYEEPMVVREEWERPLDSHVHEQQWRYVKTEDQGGVVKHVPRDEYLVNTQQTRWDRHYGAKQPMAPPIIPPRREKKTCCSPLLFALLGLLALAALIAALVLLLNHHKPEIPEFKLSNPDLAAPIAGDLTEELPAVPIMPPSSAGADVTTPPRPAARPTFTQPTVVEAVQEVETVQPTTSGTVTRVSSMTPVEVDYSNVRSDAGLSAGSSGNAELGVSSESSSSFSSGASESNDFQIPAGYRLIDGVLVRNHQLSLTRRNHQLSLTRSTV